MLNKVVCKALHSLSNAAFVGRLDAALSEYGNVNPQI